MKKTIPVFRQMVEKGEKIVYLTSYDYLTAKYAEKAGIDMILVGDSLGMVTLGYDKTFPVTMDDSAVSAQALATLLRQLRSGGYTLALTVETDF